jgi:hypothetical protein
LRQYIGAAITFFRFSFYLSFSILSACLPSLHLHTHLHLPCHLHLPPHLPSLHYTEKHKIFITGVNNLLPYSWGHRLKIELNTLKLRTTAKLKDKRTSIATVRGLYRMYATFPIPLGSHYRLPLKTLVVLLVYCSEGRES